LGWGPFGGLANLSAWDAPDGYRPLPTVESFAVVELGLSLVAVAVIVFLNLQMIGLTEQDNRGLAEPQ